MTAIETFVEYANVVKGETFRSIHGGDIHLILLCYESYEIDGGLQ